MTLGETFKVRPTIVFITKQTVLTLPITVPNGMRFTLLFKAFVLYVLKSTVGILGRLATEMSDLKLDVGSLQELLHTALTPFSKGVIPMVRTVSNLWLWLIDLYLDMDIDLHNSSCFVQNIILVLDIVRGKDLVHLSPDTKGGCSPPLPFP
jgi:hypothetical protein